MILLILLFGLLVMLFLCFAVSYAFLLPPSDFPTNIPTVPFYFTLLPLFKDVDQSELYREYLEAHLQKHGAVKIFFGARWNILVQRPEFVAEVFKYEDIYAKSGNQKKIPYSVLAEYTGDNIISSHGENWRLYQSIIKPGLQRDCEVEPVLRNGQILIRLLFEEQANSKNKSVVLPQLLQRYALANLSESLLDASFRVC
jgi:cytochrome P450